MLCWFVSEQDEYIFFRCHQPPVPGADISTLHIIGASRGRHRASTRRRRNARPLSGGGTLARGRFRPARWSHRVPHWQEVIGRGCRWQSPDDWHSVRAAYRREPLLVQLRRESSAWHGAYRHLGRAAGYSACIFQFAASRYTPTVDQRWPSGRRGSAVVELTFGAPRRSA